MSRLTLEQLLPEDLAEPFHDNAGDRADRCRDELVDQRHTYPVTLTEGALTKRQAE